MFVLEMKQFNILKPKIELCQKPLIFKKALTKKSTLLHCRPQLYIDKKVLDIDVLVSACKDN